MKFIKFHTDAFTKEPPQNPLPGQVPEMETVETWIDVFSINGVTYAYSRFDGVRAVCIEYGGRSEMVKESMPVVQARIAAALSEPISGVFLNPDKLTIKPLSRTLIEDPDDGHFD